MSRLPLWTAAALLLAALPCAGQPRTLPSLLEVMADDAALHDVAFIDGRRGWAVGDRGVVLHTDNGGRRWDLQTTPNGHPLYSVWFVDSQRGWAVGGWTTPYSHSTRGVVLQTEDGGYTWAELPDPTLPLLRGVRFFDPRRGVAWGDSTALAPSGVFFTDDGGHHWQSAHAEYSHAWTAGAFVSPDVGVVAGVGIGPAAVSGRIVNAGPTESQPATWRAASLSPDGRGWAVGHGGRVLTNNRGARRWLPPQAPLPPATNQCDWRGVAARGAQVWAVGAPGMAVLHSGDNGQSWRLQPTGVTTPLEAVAFADEKRGWAVGALGTIIATRDGGQTWTAQRRGDQRLAALVVCPTASDTPLEILAKLGAAEGYRTGAVALMADPRAPARERDRFREAAIRSGAAYADIASGFALSPAGHSAPSDALTNDQRNQMHNYLRAMLAQTRPEVVIVVPGSGGQASRLVQAAVLRAAAGDGQADSLTQLGLNAWKPKRVLRLATRPSPGTQSVATGDFDSQLGTSLQQWTLGLEGLLADTHVSPPPRIAWTALAGGVAPSAERGDPLAGLVIDRNGPARRPYASVPGSKLAALRAASLKRQAFDDLLAADTGGGDWANRAVLLTGGLDNHHGAHQLLRLANAYRQAGKHRLAADTWYLLARRYAGHPLTEHALRQLVTYYSSSETVHTARLQGERSQRTDALANVPPDFSAQGATDDWTRPLELKEHLTRAIKLGEYAEQAQPLLHADPTMRFCLAGALRRQNEPDRSAAMLATLTRNSVPAAWRSRAAADAWLGKRKTKSPVPTLTAVATTNRPKLDGTLNEPFWRAATPASFGDDSIVVARIAFDNEFLYLAIEASKLPGAAYPESADIRTRDADLRGYDRVSIRLDLDRDYQTSYDLTVDCRGWTHDACCGNRAWDPRWYVAAQREASAWTIEAAVRLADLSLQPPQPNDAWAISLERQAPGRLPQSWTGAPQADGSPAAYGLLLFGSGKPVATVGM